MRIGIDALLGSRNLHGLEEVDRLFGGVAAAQSTVLAQNFADLVANSVERIERRHRLLEDHRHFVAAQAAQLFRRGGQDLLAVELDAAGGHVKALGQELHDRECGHALAAARFPTKAIVFPRATSKDRFSSTGTVPWAPLIDTLRF